LPGFLPAPLEERSCGEPALALEGEPGGVVRRVLGVPSLFHGTEGSRANGGLTSTPTAGSTPPGPWWSPSSRRRGASLIVPASWSD